MKLRSKVIRMMWRVLNWISSMMPISWRVPLMMCVAGGRVNYAMSVDGSPVKMVFEGNTICNWAVSGGVVVKDGEIMFDLGTEKLKGSL